ncbi:hypothetical protein BCV69DRAFT_271634 [Microstroma glucosiphilum]|uniref:Mitochondrial K+-H+ exchange-related-domain-containing protein n=1 Tax=Pseudomicrostroma glucosiphilum TaxID=1684307 RepID=A0A316U9N6_9BASI|nr:hypothetical protein BCV69DRAFT_271634 [Pseudomicrostroma glucosiphilum]PWN19715.1 hypothetical protein BCV69DRAFT_271634 [Pseudomicrostroma glucosiphilum]
MRLIAVPLARVRPSAHPVCTFLAQRSPRPQPPIPTPASATASSSPAGPSSSPSSPASSEASPSSSSAQTPLTTRILTKASDFWLSLGRDGQDGKKVAVLDWKRRTYKTGEKLMDRIEYEEWALKAVDPTLGPSLNPVKKSEGEELKDLKPGETPSHLATVPIHFPPSLVSPTHLLHTLRTLTASRTPHHRRSLILCVVGMPFTIPFMLIPVVPNLPFFYLVWRAWSHWRAFQSSQYLSTLLTQNRLLPKADTSLDPIFGKYNFEPILDAPSTNPSSSSSSGASSPNLTTSGGVKKIEPVLLLSPRQIEMLKTELKLDQQSVNELVRARQQTLLSVQKGEMDKIEKAAEGVKEGEGAQPGTGSDGETKG